jgi:hypothetical protein
LSINRTPGRRLRKREIAFALAMGAVGAGGAGLMLSEMDDDGTRVVEAEPSERTYQVADFTGIATSGPQDLQVAYGDAFSVRAEGPTGELEVSVVDGELVIGPRNGFGPNWQQLRDTTFFVTMPLLSRLSVNGSGDVHVEQVRGNRFVGVVNGGFGGGMEIDALEVEEADFTINGPGEIATSGQARSTRVTISGPGEVRAGDLRSQTAVVAVNGPGEVELAVDGEADVVVRGPGEVDIDGPARCSISTSGPGSVSCGDQSDD